MIGVAGQDLAGPARAAHARAARPAAAAVGAAEVARLAGERLRQQLAAGQPGPEGSAPKLVFARLNQEITGFELELAGEDGLRYDDWTMRRPDAGGLHRPRRRLPVPALPRATRSRAARRRSCATSSPSGCSACRRRPAWTRTCHGRTCRRVSRSELPQSTAEPTPACRPAVHRGRERAAGRVRGLLGDRAAWPDVLARTETAEPYDQALWRTLAAEMGWPGWRAGALGGGGASCARRRSCVEELGRRVAPVPFLTSAVVATTAAAGRPGTPSLLAKLAAGDGRSPRWPCRSGRVLPVPAPTVGRRRAAGWRPAGTCRLTGTVTSVADALAADVLLVRRRRPTGCTRWTPRADGRDPDRRWCRWT